MKKTFGLNITAFVVALLIVFGSIFVTMQREYKIPVQIPFGQKSEPSAPGICPPFYLMDEGGEVINPVLGINDDKPYSPAMTCGKCHDYELITKGYHFTQGAGEDPTEDQKNRYLWVSSPGNYGGTWCSPAPLYSYLAPKDNDDEGLIDMTSFSFFSKGCGGCHPGGGPAEFDRDGKRYNRWMQNPDSGLVSGGKNSLDGDYYHAKWDRSGVMEADCLLCHMPDYNFKERNKQRSDFNYRWMAAAGAGLGDVKGSVRSGEPVEIQYNRAVFNPDGTLSPHIVREPRNDTCLACHAQPGWKKRGANFSPRTDVHLRAGLRCVDCHPSGTSARDPRIHGKEVHHIGKGDDPGGNVRNDLNNTMRDCISCHDTGYLGAPAAKHAWLPPVHIGKIDCTTCHIPERVVKPIQLQAGGVFSPSAKVPSKLKQLWTFYGPEMNYRNHYGNIEMMGYEDKPTEPFKPQLANYKGKIYPVNRIHSSWPGIEVEGEKALMQPKMSDIYDMWQAHFKDPEKFTTLALIKDDTGNGVPEVNRPEEIEALITAVTEMLHDKKYPMDGKRVVWVMNDRVYSDGTEYWTVSKHEWEVSPFANVHKYSHDIYPAGSALGVRGCTDCHHPNADFFFAPVVKYPFDEYARAVTQPQYEVIGLNAFWAYTGAYREAYLKPALYTFFMGIICILILLSGQNLIHGKTGDPVPSGFVKAIPWVIAFFIGFSAVFMIQHPDVMDYMLMGRKWADANHFLISIIALAIGLLTLKAELRETGRRRIGAIRNSPTKLFILAMLALSTVSGLFMFFKPEGLLLLTRASYSVFDLSLVLILITSLFALIRRAVYRIISRER